ncbi:uncharacterized protein [Rutidosis leptorrhynchoides]|uniref:uncharacterized protein n=1 Tax=Rutidosis leptorrhynchoides TaxID=125765 RepID=UPI003A99EAA7
MGCNMKSVSNWKYLEERFDKKLSAWKANLCPLEAVSLLSNRFWEVLESRRARFFWGETDNNKKIHWVKWDQVLASFDKGGLDIGSLRAFNCSLLCKWVWRFHTSVNSLWAMVLKAIHGYTAGLDGGSVATNGLWSNIVKCFDNAKHSGYLPSNALRVKVGDGRSFSFWKDNWKGDGTLKDKYGRLFRLDSNADCSISDRLQDGCWSWAWI